MKKILISFLLIGNSCFGGLISAKEAKKITVESRILIANKQKSTQDDTVEKILTEIDKSVKHWASAGYDGFKMESAEISKLDSYGRNKLKAILSEKEYDCDFSIYNPTILRVSWHVN